MQAGEMSLWELGRSRLKMEHPIGWEKRFARAWARHKTCPWQARFSSSQRGQEHRLILQPFGLNGKKTEPPLNSQAYACSTSMQVADGSKKPSVRLVVV